MPEDFIQREEFRDFFKEQKSDFRIALHEAITPLVERMDRQNGRVGKIETELHSLKQWQVDADVKARMASSLVRNLWAAGGGGLIVWVADKLLR